MRPIESKHVHVWLKRPDREITICHLAIDRDESNAYTLLLGRVNKPCMFGIMRRGVGRGRHVICSILDIPN
jgi:hypothetical protein